jgi:hypothetical protein
VDCIINMGGFDLRQAQRIYKRSLSILEDTLDRNHSNIASLLSNLGDLCVLTSLCGCRGVLESWPSRVNDPPARQIGREVAPRSRASREALHGDARRLGVRLSSPAAASSSSCSSS